MARYKIVDRSPRLLPIVLDAQLVTGSFEYALDYLIDHEIDLSELDRRYRNDDTGAPAYDPAVMLKIVLLAYSRGVVSKALPDPLYDKAEPSRPSNAKFQPSDFVYDSATRSCICPAGKKLYSTGSACSTHSRKHHKFQGAKRDCVPCHLRAQCLRYPDRTQTRQVAFFDKNQSSPLRYTERMKRAIDSARGRKLYGRRIAIVEPVFANLRHNKRLDRFTLRTQPKVNTQWNLYCLVHNIEKLAHHGYGT